jgi:hypothetical protein
MPPSAAMVKAGIMSARVVSNEIWGNCQAGKPAGIAPNLDVMVATGQSNAAASAAVRRTATMLGGMALVRRGSP